jgi:hypothetical protein
MCLFVGVHGITVATEFKVDYQNMFLFRNVCIFVHTEFYQNYFVGMNVVGWDSLSLCS